MRKRRKRQEPPRRLTKRLLQNRLDHTYLMAFLAHQGGYLSFEAMDRLHWGLEAAMRGIGMLVNERPRPDVKPGKSGQSTRGL